MRHPITLIHFCLSLLLGLSSSLQANEIVIVLSAPIKPYQDAASEFNLRINENWPKRGIKSIQPVSLTEFTLHDEPPSILTKKIARGQADLILAVGSKALALVRDLPQPIVFIMVPHPDKDIKDRPNITGVRMLVEPAKQLAAIRDHLPWVKKIGIIYDPSQTTELLNQVKAALPDSGLEIIATAVYSVRAANQELPGMASRIDALWLLPDPTVLSRISLKMFATFAMNNRTPLITFAEQYLDHGATMAIFAEPTEMGAQAAELARRLLNGQSIDQNRPEFLQHQKVRLNPRLLEKQRPGR